MQPASIVTIKEILPLYKGTTLATQVELVTFEEAGFNVVVQKNLYKVGDKAVFILPDYCVSEIPLFYEFIAPKGAESRSYLGMVNGKPRRIRAKKFNLHKGDSNPIYSNGILLPLLEVANYFYLTETGLYTKDLNDINFLTTSLNITKYEEPEEGISTKSRQKGLPEGVYKTDETNINTLWNHIEAYLSYPVTLIGSIKVDGSSISMGLIPEHPLGFITSRNCLKPIMIKKVVGQRKKTWWEFLLSWCYKPNLNIYAEELNEDAFVKYGFPYLKTMYLVGLTNTILRGELHGQGLRGSGNPNNPAAQLKPAIAFFGADKFVNGHAVKMPYLEFRALCEKWAFPTVTFAFNGSFNSREEIEATCETFFKDHKALTKQVIEGLVLQTEDATFSCKYMNNEYDSNK